MELLRGKTLLIIGLGLIGGSLAKALKRNGAGVTVFACGRNQEQLETALLDGSIDGWCIDPVELSLQADIILLAVPVLSVKPLLQTLKGNMKAGAIITDAASVKGRIVEDFKATLGDDYRFFIPGHPIAGSERSGYSASRDDLFVNRKVILTPMAAAEPLAVRTVAALWQVCGAEVHGMQVQRHDEVLAATSHLPHLLAYTLVNTLLGHGAQREQQQQVFDYAAGGFADFTRIASSDPLMWRDIFLSNQTATVSILDIYIQDLQRMRELILQAEGDTLRQEFQRARQARNQFINRFDANRNREGNGRRDRPANIQEADNMDYLARPGGQVKGDIRVPGDKSISHRAIILGALAQGVTRVSGFLEGEDSLHTLQAFRDMGVVITGPENGELSIYGVGRKGLQAPRKPLYLGNSGTAMRLLCGLLAAQTFDSELSGDKSLNRRPMRRVSEPLQKMGAVVETDEQGTPPLRIKGAKLHGIDYVMPMASAQVKSCLLLAALYAEGETRITEPAPCRDHTERMLSGFSYPLQRSDEGRVCTIAGGHELQATDIDVPADISSAAFFLVAATITPGAELRLRHVGVNPTRTGIIHLLQAMGADIRLENTSQAGGEPVADILVRHAPLHGINVPEAEIPLAIDEFPVFFIAAACAAGETILHGAEELRVKESDRIQAMADGLSILGIENETFADGIRIRGGDIRGGEINSKGDHRIAMAFAVASLRAAEPIVIRDCANVATSFPGFLTLANAVGMQVSVQGRN
ncbi:MAG: bifunctional prephenate dehydrogenase/3-phosphoshikimate 1-carboxyvinyltransferase [Pseudomonadales bacterium]|nr:bifunctional prephenate dehydrogenase/3-phosphoshikimate 1-carboxyvinyltransferase [Pseudomonadales bacterium]